MGLGLGLGLILVCTACSKAPDQSVKPEAVQAKPAEKMPVDMPDAPAAQLDLVAAISAGRNDGNFCVTFQKTAGFTDWAVKISDFRTSTVNSSIDITFDAGHNVQMEQVVQTTDPLYATIAPLRMRDMARISGTFTHGNSECGYQLGIIGVHLSRIIEASR